MGYDETTMRKAQRRAILIELTNDLPGHFPAVEATEIEGVLSVAEKIADGSRYEHLVVEALDVDGEHVIRVSDDDGNPVARMPTDDTEVADLLVAALKALRIPTRLKSTKLVGCGVCDHYHPSNFNGDCRKDGDRFTTPNDSDDIAERFDNGDPGTDLLDYEQTHEQTVFIDVKGGEVEAVRNLPDGWSYEINDLGE